MSDARREPGAVRGTPGAREPGEVRGRVVRQPRELPWRRRLPEPEPPEEAGPPLPWLPRLPLRPAEGWLTLAGVVIMVTALAWSIDDVKWVIGAGGLTDFLPLVGFAGILVGFAGPKLGWGRWTTHFIGVGFAAIVLPIIAGGIVLGDAVTGWGPVELTARFREAARVVYRVWVDLAIEGRPLTSEYGHYFIAFGVLLWATGQFAAYAVFGHHRALDAVIVTGLLLIGNMSLTENNQLHLMVLFSVGALGLLARSHAYDERVTWLRRRIGDPATVAGLYLRGSTVFIGGAVVGSLLLTATASSAPLQGLWRDVPANLVEFSQWLQRYVPLGGGRDFGIVTFGDETAIIGVWNANDSVAFRAQLPADETERFYWQAGVYSDFELNAWTKGTTRTVTAAAGAGLLDGTPDDATGRAGVREVELVVNPEGSIYRMLVVSPQTIEKIDRAATVKITGPGAYFASARIDSTDRYTVTALVPTVGNEEGATTANRLRVASREYPPEIQRLYLAVPAGAIGPRAAELFEAILDRAPADNPYDIAQSMEAYLRDSRNFRYDTNVQDESQGTCLGVSTVECFARIQAGYCQYYASTMAILLREAGIPTRLVQGFLPGTRDANGAEVVRNSSAHAWVQVYFPGYGWVDFDPTGGNQVNQRGPLPSGPPASPTPRPSFSFGTSQPTESDPAIRDRSPVPGDGGGTIENPPSAGPFVAIAGLLVVGALALAFAAWRRGPRAIPPDRAWGSIGRWAARFGFGPRPSQTVYEYAGALGDALPAARPELRTVANAKVEIAYGRQDLSSERLRAVAEAHRRLRLRLLQLAFRRPGRPGRDR